MKVKKLFDRVVDDLKGIYDFNGDPDIIRKLEKATVYVGKDMFDKAIGKVSRGVKFGEHVDRFYLMVQTAKGRAQVDVVKSRDFEEDYYIIGEIPKVQETE